MRIITILAVTTIKMVAGRRKKLRTKSFDVPALTLPPPWRTSKL
jgi:hypothetical protein